MGHTSSEKTLFGLQSRILTEPKFNESLWSDHQGPLYSRLRSWFTAVGSGVLSAILLLASPPNCRASAQTELAGPVHQSSLGEAEQPRARNQPAPPAHSLAILQRVALATAFQAQAEATEITSDPEKLEWSVEYDQSGRPIRLKDPGGRITALKYEFCQGTRLCAFSKVLPTGEEIVSRFDKFGRTVEVSDPTGKSLYDYDGFGSLQSVKRETFPKLAFRHDSLGRITKVTIGNGFTVDWKYDFMGRPESIRTPAGDIKYEYWPSKGQVTRTLPNGVRTRYERLPDGKLAKIVHANKENTVLARFEYKYRPDGLLGEVVEWQPTGECRLEYEYDLAGRLVEVRDSRGQRSQFGYDHVGNRVRESSAQGSVKSSFDWAGRIRERGTEVFRHDAAGNLSERRKAGGSETKFIFDEANRLARVKRGTLEISYSYDGDGQLIKRQVGNQVTRFVPSPFSDIWRPLLAIEPDGTEVLYVWDQGILGAFSKNGAEFYLEDFSGSPRLVVNAEGKVIENRSYSPFGQPESTQERGGLKPAYSGLFFDHEAELYLTRARVYDASLGRFLQREPRLWIPLGSQKSLSAYNYCGNDPVNYSDREGTRPVPRSRDDDADRCRVDQDQASDAQDEFRKYQEATADMTPDQRQLLRLLATNKVQTALEPSADDNLLRKAILGVRLADALEELLKKKPIEICNMNLEKLLRVLLLKKKHKHKVRPYWIRYYLYPRWWNYQPLTYYWRSYPAYYWSNVGRLYSWSSRYYSSSSSYYASSYRYGLTSGYNYVRPVGGVWLSGIGKVVRDLGQLRGVGIDHNNGRLMLLGGKTPKGLDLEVLRLDDLVAIFRSVYLHGQGPHVSIEDDPKNPEGPKKVVYGPEMADTLAGWILYECDRVMKNYWFGTDNDTGRRIASKIPGYDEVVSAQFTAVVDEWRRSHKVGRGPRCRGWITPAGLTRRANAGGTLTLLDVPLKLKMELRSGTRGQAPPREDLAYADWFTKNYEALTREWVSSPPEGSYKGTKFHVFAELKRIALITAIAEQLRDQGVAMPSWMMSYKIIPYPTPKTWKRTYSVRQIQGYRVHVGGVTITPAYYAVMEGMPIRSVTKDPEATAISKSCFEVLHADPRPSTLDFNVNARRYTAAVLPGPETRDVGGCQLEVSDLRLPMNGISSLSLTRRYNSLFKLDGEVGAVWTFDLPRLFEYLQPVSQPGGRGVYKTITQLSTPLGSLSAIFRERRHVPELNGEFRVPQNSPDILALAKSKEPKSKTAETELLFRDGRNWHFDKNGYLVAQCEGSTTTVFRRNGNHRIGQVEGWQGDKLMASISLEYDVKGRVVKASAGGDNWAVYSYDDDGGRLVRVKTPTGEETYDYKGTLLTSWTKNGQTRKFVYDDFGRLAEETDGAGKTRVANEISRTRDGTKLMRREVQSDESVQTSVYEYDKRFRPVSEVQPDGTKVSYTYGSGGSVSETLTEPKGTQCRLIAEAGKKELRVTLPEGGAFTLRDESAQRLVISHGGKRIAAVLKHKDGALNRIEGETTALRWYRTEDGSVKELKINQSGENPSGTEWMKVKLDKNGRAVELTDSTRNLVQMEYGATGSPVSVKSARGWVRIDRNRVDKPERIVTSWGLTQVNKFDSTTGKLRKVQIESSGKSAAAIFSSDGLSELRSLDGGTVKCSYYGDGPARGQVKTITTEDGLTLTYTYDGQGRLSSLRCGDIYSLRCKYDGKGNLISFATVQAK